MRMSVMKVKLELIIVDDDVIDSAKSWTCSRASKNSVKIIGAADSMFAYRRDQHHHH